MGFSKGQGHERDMGVLRFWGWMLLGPCQDRIKGGTRLGKRSLQRGDRASHVCDMCKKDLGCWRVDYISGAFETRILKIYP